MAKIPVRFKRVAAAFDDVARARFCESSGSEHSPEHSTDLSDLVKSFMEKDAGVVVYGNEEEIIERSEMEMESTYWCDSEKKEILKGLLRFEDDHEKQRIYAACSLIGDQSSPSFKRRLMIHLRDKGFDAGLCKSKWERNKGFPGGSYEYIDVNLGKNRYIIDVNLAAEFEIARPIEGYMSLLDVFHPIFIGKPEELKQIVRIMCGAVKESMKTMDMLVPPWRKNAYMLAKWFGSYKRTSNAVATSSAKSPLIPTERSFGFVAASQVKVRPNCYCKDDFGSKAAGFRVGQLSAAFTGLGL